MSYIYTKEDYNIACQPILHLYTKIEIYNKNDNKLVKVFKGMVNHGSCSINSDSKVRRNFNATIVPINDDSIKIAGTPLFWVNKMFKLFVGVKTTNMSEVKWYPQGVYTATNASVSYDAISNQLQLSCSDRMVELDGTVNGEIGGALTLSIPASKTIFKKSWLTTYSSFDNAYNTNNDTEDVLMQSTIKSLVCSLFTDTSLTDIQKEEIVIQIQNACDSLSVKYKIALRTDDNDIALVRYNVIKPIIKSLINQYTTLTDYLIEDIGEYKGTDSYRYYKQYQAENKIWNCLPYDQEFSCGSTVASMLEEICTLYSGYDYAFDEDGVLQIRMIPTLYEDDIVISYKELSPLLTADDTENASTELTSIRNVCEVWGQCFETDYYTESCSTSGSIYNVSLNNYTEYSNGDIISIKCNSNSIADMKININGLGNILIYDEYTERLIKADSVVQGQVYSFKYKKSYIDKKYVEKFYLLGQYQVHALCVLSNGETLADGTYSKAYFQKKYNCNSVKLEIIPDSPYVVQKIGERFKCYSGGTYENIQSDSSAIETSSYELWKNCRLTDNVTIKTSLIPWINEYQKISYKKANTDEIKQYITHNITHNYDDCTTTIEMYTFYPLYQDINEFTYHDFSISSSNLYMTGLFLNAYASSLEIPSEFLYEGKDYKVISIGNNGFANNTILSYISLPNTIIFSGDNAFKGCTSLVEATLSKNLENVSNGMFQNCTSLKSISIPNSVETIGEKAFNNTGINSVKFGRGLKELKANSFSNNLNLNAVDISGHIRTIGDYAFFDCKSLNNIVLNEGIYSIGDYAFSNTNAEIVILPNSLQELSPYAFSNTSSYVLYFGNIDTDDMDYVVHKDYNLELNKITISWLNINSNSLSVEIPSVITKNGIDFTVTSINYFRDYFTKAEKIVLPNTITSISNTLFSNNSIIKYVDAKNANVDSIYFYNMARLQTVFLPSTLTSINENCFCYCKALNYVSAPPNIKSIGKDAFLGCKCLTAFVFPDTLTSIGTQAFYGSSINSLTIPSSDITIGDRAFALTGINILYIPKNVLSIGSSAFSGCSIIMLNIEDGITNEVISNTSLNSSLDSEYGMLFIPSTLETTQEMIDNSGAYKVFYPEHYSYTRYTPTNGEIAPLCYSELDMSVQLHYDETIFYVFDDASTDTIIPNYKEFNGIRFSFDVFSYDGSSKTLYDKYRINNITLEEGFEVFYMKEGNYLNDIKIINLPSSIHTIDFPDNKLFDLVTFSEKNKHFASDNMCIYVKNNDDTLTLTQAYGTGINFIMPSNLSDISKDAFIKSPPTSLRSITINASYEWEDLTGYMFRKLHQVDTVIVNSLNPVYRYTDNCLIHIDDGIMYCPLAYYDVNYSIDLSDMAVTNIWDNAFRESTTTYIKLPSSLKSIMSCAFQDSNIEGLGISEETYFNFIDSYAFANCDNLIGCSDIVYEISDDCEGELGSNAFLNCSSLSMLTIKNVKIIKEKAFYGCNNLELTIKSDYLKSIEDNAFCEVISVTFIVSNESKLIEIPEDKWGANEIIIQILSSEIEDTSSEIVTN